ncbi:MAG TPA: IS630 family transposase [Gemmatimonadales bacterium]|nr:IS630 family transposase [Gemmatimonadales bacterium]
MEDVLARYEKPYDPQEPVLCLDEKPVCLHADVRPPRPARPGHLAKRDSEYRRCGTANLFTVVEPQAGRHFTCATPDRSARQFARVMRRVIAAYPRARTIHLVMDNLNIHCEKSLTDHWGRRLGRRLWRRLTVHFTPKHGSWLNQAEIELSLVSRGCLGTRRIESLAQLRGDTRAWTTRANRAKTRIRWQFTREQARRKFGYQKNLSSRSKT